MTEILVLGLIISFCLSLILTPFIIRLAFKVGALDQPNDRKIHKTATPRLGGIAIFTSFLVTVIFIYFLLPQPGLQNFIAAYNWALVMFAMLIILTVGICDDIFTLKAGPKFLVQLIAASLLYFAGFQITTVTNLFSFSTFNLGFFSLPITLLWIVGITNAFNLIDGLDGLAAGIAIIAGLTIAGISFIHNDISTTIIALLLAGSLAGFLRYNFNPAKIFLGDSGSLFIGFILAILSIKSSAKGSTAFSVIIPLLALGLPIIDTLLAMMRRMLRLFLPEQTLNTSLLSKAHVMFLPDKRHIHHRLLAKGYSQRIVVLILYSVACAFGMCALGVTAGSFNSAVIIIAIGLFIATAVKVLGYREIAIFRNGIMLNVYKNTLLKHSVLQVYLDFISVFAALLLADYFITGPHYLSTFSGNHLLAIIIIGSTQLALFAVNGLYRHQTHLSGLGDFLHLFRVTVISSVLTAGLIIFANYISNELNNSIFIILDYYFLFTLIAGSRVAFHALNYLFHREIGNGKKAVIYGADSNGLVTLQALLKNENNKVIPVGFLDDNPELERKYLDGYPIFGGHWKLEGLLQKRIADEIIVAGNKVNIRILERIKKIAHRHNIPVRVSTLRLKSITQEKHGYNKPAHRIRTGRERIVGHTT